MRFLYIILLTILLTIPIGVPVSADTNGTVLGSARGIVTGSRVNVRDSGCLTDSNILYMVDHNEPVEILGIEGDFYRAVIRQDYNVYITREFVRINEIIGTANEMCLIYDLPEEAGGLATGVVSPGEGLIVEAGFREWYKVRGGYIEKKYITIPGYVSVAEENLKIQYSYGTHADEIIAYAKTLIGISYAYGSTNPNRGFDCSGYINHIFDNFGIDIGRSSVSMSKNGALVGSINDLEKGDLVFFATDGGTYITHVGMYIGNGEFIHSSSSTGSVVVDPVTEGTYARQYVKAVRVL